MKLFAADFCRQLGELEFISLLTGILLGRKQNSSDHAPAFGCHSKFDYLLGPSQITKLSIVLSVTGRKCDEGSK